MPPTRVSIARRIVQDIRAQIRAGELKPGDPLPSLSQLQERYNCSNTPVKTALRDLQTLGLIEGRQGKANYVTGEAPSRA